MIKKSDVLKILNSWLGIKEPNHKKIIDIYNKFFDVHGHRPRGYRVTYTDAWCATGLCASIIEAGGGLDYPMECGCQELIRLYEAKNQYFSRGSFEPQAGDIVFYDWQGDGHSDHVGMVNSVEGQIISVIECNNDDAVKIRNISVTNNSIKGFARPEYAEEQNAPSITPPACEDGVVILRLYNENRGVHFFTVSLEEANACLNAGWNYEGVAWIAPKEGQGVFRFLKENVHTYTPDIMERTALVEAGYAEEGEAFKAKMDTAFPYIPVYRAYNAGNGDYLFTIDGGEYTALCKAGWIGQGIRFYGLR